MAECMSKNGYQLFLLLLIKQMGEPKPMFECITFVETL